jgi:hypothetical protein
MQTIFNIKNKIMAIRKERVRMCIPELEGVTFHPRKDGNLLLVFNKEKG